jgi:small subunit ribosomal protein S15
VLTKEEKQNIIDKYKMNPSDTGSVEVQIALITHRINYLTKHFSNYKKDFHSRIGLMRLVGQRKKLLEYLKKNDVKRYEKLIKELNLRK